MQSVSKDNPFYFITSVTHKRLPVFQTEKLKEIVCKALNEARRSASFMIFSYSIMPEHLHITTDSSRSQSDMLRYLNGITARRVIDYLKENNFNTSLAKLRTEIKPRKYKHSLWEHHSNTFEIKTEAVLMQKINYIHQNPVTEGLVEKAEDYLYSSSRIWKGCPLDNEPLEMDIHDIKWRRG